MEYDINLMNVELTRSMLADTYDKHNCKGHEMLMRVRITRRVLSILEIHPDWKEDEVFCKVQDSFRKGKGGKITRIIDRELYDYFKQNWLDIIKLGYVEEGKEYDYYAHHSNVKLTKEQWVEKARAKWGNAYDYSESEYIAGLKPVTIRCIKHNYHFTVQAGNHICTSGRKNMGGCPLCTQERLAEVRRIRLETTVQRKTKKTTAHKTPEEKKEERQQLFIRKVRNKYGDKYDLSKAVYKGREDNVTLICPIHGEFEITPRTLFNGSKGKKPHGCYECEGIKRIAPALTEDVFRSRMKMLYGDRLDFSGSVFTGASDKITFSCAKHGLQTVKTGSLMKGADCPRCAGRIKTLEDVIEQAKAVHGDRYDYSQTSLTRSEKGVLMMKDIRCKEHGLYTARVDVHIGQGGNCPRCAGYQNIISPAEHEAKYMAEAKRRFGDRFDYSEVKYKNKRSIVTIRCKEHDCKFKMRLEDHVRSCSGGCPLCADSAPSEGEIAIMLWLQDHKINFEREHKIYHDNIFCKRQYLKVDFYLPDYNLFIEYNGEQHYKDVPYFFDKNYTLEDQQERDETLRLYCKANKIELMEIPYWDYDNIGKILTVWIAEHTKNVNVR